MRRGVLLVGLTILVLGAALIIWIQRDAEPVPAPPLPDPALAMDDDVRAAIDAAHAAAVESPSDAGVRVRLAFVYDAAHMHALAQTTYEQAIALDDEHAEWWYHLARMHERQGNTSAAFAAIDQTAQLAPNEFIVPVTTGMWQLDAGEPAQAEASFRDALEINADSLAARHGLARALVSQQKFADALPILEHLRGALPTDSTVRQLLGRCYMQMGRVDEGSAELALGVTAKWDWTIEDTWLDNVLRHRAGYRAQFERAMSLLSAGSPAQAIPLFEQIRVRQPADVPTALAISTAYKSIGKLDDAMRTLQNADLLNPDHFAVKLNLALAYHARGDVARAMQFTDEAIALNPTLSAGHAQRARLLLDQNRPVDAERSIDEAIRCDASNADARFLKAQLLLNRGQHAEAAELLEQTTRSHPHIAHGYALLAVARYNLGQGDAAMNALAHAERLDPQNATVLSIRQQLQQRGSRTQSALESR